MKPITDNQMTTDRTVGHPNSMKRTAITITILACLVSLGGCMADFGEGDDFLEEDIQQESFEVVDPVYCDGYRNQQWPSASKDLEFEIRELVNDKRLAGATCGGVTKPPVGRLNGNPSLRCAARVHAEDMALNSMTGHTGSNGSSVEDRIMEAGFAGTNPNENFAGTTSNTPPTAETVVNGWMGSTGHCNTIMDSRYTNGHVGFFHAPGKPNDAFDTIIVMTFGTVQ